MILKPPGITFGHESTISAQKVHVTRFEDGKQEKPAQCVRWETGILVTRAGRGVDRLVLYLP